MKNLMLSISIIFLSTLSIQAQEKESRTEKIKPKESIAFKLKEVQSTPDSIAKPKIYVDGKLFDFDISLIDQDQIESLFIVKGLEAKEKYNAPGGVYLIKTKKEAFIDTSTTKIRIQKTGNIKKNQPLYIIDGKVIKNPDKIKKLNPDDIESISVLKDKAAETLYNAENGVIIIKTRKGEK